MFSNVKVWWLWWPRQMWQTILILRKPVLNDVSFVNMYFVFLEDRIIIGESSLCHGMNMIVWNFHINLCSALAELSLVPQNITICLTIPSQNHNDISVLLSNRLYYTHVITFDRRKLGKKCEAVWKKTHPTILVSSPALWFRFVEFNTTFFCYRYYHRWRMVL